jgi:hypothetical protein
MRNANHQDHPVQHIHQAPKGAAEQQKHLILAGNPIPAPVVHPNPEINNPANNPIDAARDQAIIMRRTRSGRRVRPNQRFFDRDFFNFSSHEKAESFGERKPRGHDLDCQAYNNLSSGGSVSMLAQEAKSTNESMS